MVLEKTIERYVNIWKRIQASDLELKELRKVNFSEFKKRTGIKSKSQWNLAKAFARNPERQKQVNKYLAKKKIPKTVIERAPETIEIPQIKPTFISVKKKGAEYGIAELIDNEGNSYWIKYKDEQDFNEQKDILMEKYKIQPKSIIFHGIKPYHIDFTDIKFKEAMLELGMDI